jgi:hypothetical protein
LPAVEHADVAQCSLHWFERARFPRR